MTFDKAPVTVGEKHRSLQTGKVATVLNVKHYGGVLGWHARVRIDPPGILTNLTCSKDGLRGYRKVTT